MNLTNILFLRQIILLSSKVLSLFFCGYFILNIQEYEVALGGWVTYFLPNIITSTINTFFSTIGTLILIIPMTLIVLSFLMPVYLPLQFAAGFFGVAGTLFVVASGLLTNTITHVYNMRLLIVTKIIPLEEKRLLFKTEYLRILDEKYKSTVKLYHYLQEQLLEAKFAIYDLKLMELKESLAIKLYASEVIQLHAASFVSEPKGTTVVATSSNGLLIKILIGGVCVLVVVAGVRFLWEHCTGDGAISYIQKMGHYSLSLFKKAEKSTTLTGEFAKHALDATNAIPDSAATVTIAGVNMLAVDTANKLTGFQTVCNGLTRTVDEHSVQLAILMAKLT